MMKLHIGTNRVHNEEITLPTSVFNRHIGLVGQTGSGKTVGLKVLIEEAALSGIPSVVIDPKGDLAQFIIENDISDIEQHGGDYERAKSFKDSVEIRVWTPVRSKGLPICLNPFVAPSEDLDEEEKISSWDLMAAGFTSIAGFDIGKPEGAEIKSYIVSLLEYANAAGKLPTNFYALADLVETPELVKHASKLSASKFNSRVVDLVTKSSREKLARRFRGQQTGVNNMLFTLGSPLDFDLMSTPCEDGKTPINIIYVNTLNSEDLKQNFIHEVGRRLYDWMIKLKPEGDETKLIFAIDEAHPYMPPYPKNPPAKKILEMLAKQGRAFGMGCIFATQNIASVDYKIFGQSQTLLIGQFTRPQDIKKVKDMLSVENSKVSTLADEVPKLKPGSFQLVNNLVFDEPQQVKIRWLYSTHKSGTTSEDEIEENTSAELRKCIESLSRGEKISSYVPEDLMDDLSIQDDQVDDLPQKEESKQIDSDDEFEMNFLGGFSLLKDSRDTLSVMLAITNILTSIVLLFTSYYLIEDAISSNNFPAVVIIGVVVSLLSSIVLLAEILADGDLPVLAKLRKRAKPIQYVILIWLWVLWFLISSKEIEVQNIELPVEIVQTMMTAFVLLEFGHRIKIGNIVMPKGRNIPDIFSNSFISIKTVVTTTELDKLRATSEELMASFRLILDGIVIFTLLSVIGLQNTFEYFSSEEWLARVLSIYSLILISQLVTRSRS